MRRALSIAVVIALQACEASAPVGACERQEWVDPADPMAIALHASGVVTWSAGDDTAPVVVEGTLTSATGTTSTTLEVETVDGPLHVEIGLAPERLGVLPIGEAIEVTLGDGVVITMGGRIRTAVISRRDATEAVAANVTFRQAYAECVRSIQDEGCYRAMATPLVDVVTGASVVRLPPGGVWQIPDEMSPDAEIEIVRSVRAPAPDELDGVSEPRCAAAPAQEIGAIVRHLQ